MMSLTFGLFTQVSGSGPLGPLVLIWGWGMVYAFSVLSQMACLEMLLPERI